jgi:hypothetical protein
MDSLDCDAVIQRIGPAKKLKEHIFSLLAASCNALLTMEDLFAPTTAPAEPDGASIEALFRPSTRFRDTHGDDLLPEGLTEVELLPGLSLEDVRATGTVTGTTWNAFHSFAGQNLVSMTPDVYLCNGYRPGTGDPVVLELGANVGNSRLFVYARPDTADAAATATCDLRLCGSPLGNL